jgi:hypothetical protein
MDECSICLVSLTNKSEEKLYTTTCGHVFHIDCIHNWLKSSDNCPYCRKILIEVSGFSKDMFDVVIEHCPSREFTAWRRITMFSNHPDVNSIQTIQRNDVHDHPLINIYDEQYQNQPLTMTPPPPPPFYPRVRAPVFQTRKSTFQRAKAYVKRKLSI